MCSVAKSCLTLCSYMDCSPPCSSVQGILQARILEGGAISFSRASSQPRDRTPVSHIAGRLFTDWAIREVPSQQTSNITNHLFVCVFFLPHHVVCGIWVPGPGIEPRPLAVKAPSPNHWATRESIWINIQISELGAVTLQLLTLRPCLQGDWGLL